MGVYYVWYSYLLGDSGGNKWSVVMHFPVTNADNDIGVNYRTALINSGLGGTTRLKDGNGLMELYLLLRRLI